MNRQAAIAGRRSAGETMQIVLDDLASMTSATDPEIESLTRTFQQLAGQSSRVLGLASTIVECIEDDSVKSVLPTVQALGSSGISFIESRLEATHGISETAAAEMHVLQRLAKMTRSQSGIALRTRVLAMMANIERGRLGNSGAAFAYLAGELSNFSRLLCEDTDELERRTDARRVAIEATNRVLALELPRLAAELVRIRAELGNDLALLESSLAELESIPAQFKLGVEEIAARIAGAVAAIQSYDITHQQIEHVRGAVRDIAAQIRAGEKRLGGSSSERACASLGITVQMCQLQQVRDTVANWMSRIKDCLDGMLKVSATNLAGISPIVRAREREISAALAHIELLESQSKARSKVICRTIGEHSTLLRLIDEQVKQAAVTRQTLHLLSLNTIIEADRLGAEANAVLELGRGISDLSLAWSQITDQSGQAFKEISELVVRIGVLKEAFSQAGEQRLRQAQVHVRAGLQRLQATSECAAKQASDIELGLDAMKTMAGGITKSVDVLDRSYRQLDEILNHLQDVQLQLESVPSEALGEHRMEEIRQQFSASYTTEVEREVLRAALGGTAPPPMQLSLEGNGVELF